MKKIIFLQALLFSALTNWAQPGYQVVETPKWLISNYQNSYTINLIGSDAQTIESVWAAQCKKAGGKEIQVAENGVKGFQNVFIRAISPEPLQVYFRTYEDTEQVSTYLTVWFKVADKFISTHRMPESFQPISRLLLRFSLDMEEGLPMDIFKSDLKRVKEEYPASKN
ncbi:MAG: hypothetical protein R2825_09185 [Saprospiraceae bacterium]